MIDIDAYRLGNLFNKTQYFNACFKRSNWGDKSSKYKLQIFPMYGKSVMLNSLYGTPILVFQEGKYPYSVSIFKLTDCMQLHSLFKVLNLYI